VCAVGKLFGAYLGTYIVLYADDILLLAMATRINIYSFLSDIPKNILDIQKRICDI